MCLPCLPFTRGGYYEPQRPYYGGGRGPSTMGMGFEPHHHPSPMGPMHHGGPHGGPGGFPGGHHGGPGGFPGGHPGGPGGGFGGGGFGGGPHSGPGGGGPHGHH